MTHKDYELLAGVFLSNITQARQAGHDSSVTALENVAMELGEALEDENKTFNRLRFLQACGIPLSKQLTERAQTWNI